MTCCAPALDDRSLIDTNPALTPEEIRLSSRDLGNGILQTDLSVPDIHCAACIRAIESTLNNLPGIADTRVNLSSRRVAVKWHSDELPPFVEALKKLGYPPHLFEDTADAKDPVLSELLRALGISGFAAGNIMLLSVSIWSGADASTRDLFHWISALIALPVLAFAGRIYYRSAWNAIASKRLNMDVPIAIGITTAYALSLYETIHSGHHAYFDGVVTLLFFLLIGRTLDHLMRQRARKAVSTLAKMSPRGAMVIHEDGSREYLPLGEIQPDMELSIAAGERFPVDGIVSIGRTDIDCSMATGESAPLFVEPGTEIRAGMLNLTHPIQFRATAAAKDSFLFEIMRLMEAAESSRALYRRIADRVSAAYAPVVHLTAALSFIGWMIATGDWHRAITIAVAVLIITCPCALGLAVPMVQVVAARRLFESGIMVKDGSAMERLAQIDTAVFDKTGTLTLGKPRLINKHELNTQALTIAAVLASYSRHPLSQSILEAGENLLGQAPALESVTEVPGFGMEAKLNGKVYRLGRASWAIDNNIHQSGTVLSLDGQKLLNFEFEDRLRPDVQSTFNSLLSKGIAIEIMSGDTQEQVKSLSEKLGIKNFRAEVLPGEKSARLDQLALEGHKTLMVGDGLNDAPALAAAYVSMAPSTAADIGRSASDFVFLHESLAAVTIARQTSQRAMTLIRQNFGIAFVYNLIAVPIAIFGYVTPLVAALAMSGSSILVVANALRLSVPSRTKKSRTAPALHGAQQTV